MGYLEYTLPPVVILSVALAIRQYYSSSQRKKAAVDSKKGSEKKGYYAAEDEPIPEPTPLMITPEQVKSYDDRPWRPFRWPYHQTMSIFKLDVNHWLDMDKFYWHYIQEKERIYHEYGDQNIGWLPESWDACVELMEIVRDHMVKRYPLLFTKVDGSNKIIKNELTGETLDTTFPLKEHPLVYVSKMAKEDFYIVLKRDDGRHYMVAGAVPFPGGSFAIKDKIGKHIDQIHSDVPYYETKLKRSMERWFERMQPSELVERASWYMTWDRKLMCSNVYALKADEKIDSDIPPTEFNFRVERQTLRRLPRSKAIIFTNHPVYYGIEEVKDEPLIPSLIKKIIFEGPEDIIKYKNFESFRDHAAPYLDSLIQRQIDLGIIKEDTPIKTLDTYPFAHFVKDAQPDGWKSPHESAKEYQKNLDPKKFEV
ncbi:heme-dependent oxidative N-demethylase family protein ASCRUDRAFT_75881 [Ascoidea rubescens DSM 1968]|uniref:HRQ family protein n=1 Tax=Ascoidea rubescens DSM 1968 TaxID=1344418 RepID=A0A1D2VHT5_9ASCO|nr:hypothetical protein ASCRUDRAFT_75881 [Ascoidea rubescens DSM 1968]ODV61169.1 hypothetical protein ASCRUDRAFT_75881 [Ascoidea rubescens DSM 1968]